MAKIISITGTSNSTVLQVSVTAAAGGAGSKVPYYTGRSSRINIVNTSVSAGLEYKSGTDAWKFLGHNEGAVYDADIVRSPLYMRKTANDPGTVTAEVTIESAPAIAPIVDANSNTQISGLYTGPIYIPLGDSITGNFWSSNLGATLSRTNNVTTVTLTGHPYATGQTMRVEQMTDDTFNIVAQVTKTGANTFTYPNPGPDATTSGGGIRNPRWKPDTGYVGWFQMKMGNRLSIPFNAGVGGNTTTQMLARFDTEVAAYSPNLVTIMGGINDLSGSTSAQIIANLQLIYSKIRGLNAICAPLTILPLGSGHPNYSVANNQKILEINDAIRRECIKYPGMILVDAYAAVVDPLSATGQPKTGYLDSSAIHPAAIGAEAIASAMFTAISPYFPLVNTLPSSASDNRGVVATNTNYWRSLPINSSGGTAGSGVTGTVATQFQVNKSGSSTVVASVNARTVANDGDAIGYNQRATFTAGAANDTVTITQNNSGWASGANAPVIGNAYYLECSVQVTGVSGSNLSEFYAQATFVIDGVNVIAYVLQPSDTTYPVTDFKGVIFSAPFFLTGSACSNVVISVIGKASAAGTAVNIDVGRVQFRELPAGSTLYC